jgi:hypothetical protein
LNSTQLSIYKKKDKKQKLSSVISINIRNLMMINVLD